MSTSLEEKLMPAETGHGTKARASLKQLRNMNGFVEQDGEYLVHVMGGPSMGGETLVWRHINGRGEDAIYEVL